MELDSKGTNVVGVDRLIKKEDFAGSLKPEWYGPEDNMKTIVKVSWVNAGRPAEPQLVAAVRNRIATPEDAERVGRHLPWIVDSKDHTLSTGRVRELFGVKREMCWWNGALVPVKNSQVLRSHVAEKLRPAERLKNPMRFFDAFLGAVGG